MAILSDVEVQEILLSQRHPEVQVALLHESRLKLHNKPTLKEPISSEAYKGFMHNYPDKLLVDEKRDTFRQLLSFPLPTVDVTEEAYRLLYKVFDGENKSFQIYAKDRDLEQDMMDYLKLIKEPDFWKTKGWNLMKCGINCVISIDLSNEINGSGLPAPYINIIPTENIWSIENKSDGSAEYVIYEMDPPRQYYNLGFRRLMVVLDDAAYRVYGTKGSMGWKLLINNTHDLGYCPARQFWSHNVDDSSFLKHGPITSKLGDLDWMLFTMVSSRHLELYAGYPIITVYETNCTYTTAEGIQCNDGWLEYFDQERNEVSKREPCPNCRSSKNLINPGTVLSSPPKREKDDPDMMPGLQITKGDTDSVKILDERITKMIDMFLTSVAGSMVQQGREAINEKQVESTIEDRLTILYGLKQNFETIQTFVRDTIGLLRYGPEKYYGSTCNYGTRFYLQNQTNLAKQYKESKANGMPMFQLQLERQNIYKKAYHTNHDVLERLSILEQLEPLRDLTFNEIGTMKANMAISHKDYVLKMYFNDIVERFEREVGGIVTFMSEIDLEIKISIMRDKFYEYALEMVPEPEINEEDDDEGNSTEE